MFLLETQSLLDTSSLILLETLKSICFALYQTYKIHKASTPSKSQPANQFLNREQINEIIELLTMSGNAGNIIQKPRIVTLPLAKVQSFDMRMHQGQVEKKRSQSHLKDELGLEIMEASQSKIGSNNNSSSDLHAS